MKPKSDYKRFKVKGILIFSLICFGNATTIPKDENVAVAVRFSNSLVPPLFQIFAGNYSNLVLSPFGLATTIAITMDCVHGKSFDEITKLFKLQSKPDRQQLRTGFKTILNDFREGSINDELAGSYNKAYLTTSKAFPMSFVEHLSDNYLVDVITNSSIAKNLNSVQILELRTDSGIMSHWKDFQKLVVYTYLSYSASAPFYGAMNKTTNIPMIPLIGYFKAGYLSKLDCEGAELLFENKKASLLLLMPTKIDELLVLQNKLFKENFFSVLDSLPQQETQIMIPQLSAVTNNLQLIPFLKLLGIVSVFSPKWDSKQKQDVFVQSIKQNAFFSTSFSSLSSIGTFSSKYDAGSPSIKTEIRKKRESLMKITFNKPFMYFLIHRESGLILTTGHISNPKILPNQ
ncbi:hypothetical protein PGB90_007793 [Kerria lacca]